MLGLIDVDVAFSPVFLLHFLAALGASGSGAVGFRQLFANLAALGANKFDKWHKKTSVLILAGQTGNSPVAIIIIYP